MQVLVELTQVGHVLYGHGWAQVDGLVAADKHFVVQEQETYLVDLIFGEEEHEYFVVPDRVLCLYFFGTGIDFLFNQIG